MSTYGVVGSNPFSDLTNDDYEDLIYRYIGQHWSLTTPSDLNKTSIFRTTTVADMVNEPSRGLRSYWIWVQHLRRTQSRTAFGSSMGRAGYIANVHTFIIHMFAYRLKTALTFPELGQIQREVERILFQYPTISNTFEIIGILHFDNLVEENVREVNNLGESFAGVYEKLITIDAFYHKCSTLA